MKFLPLTLPTVAENLALDEALLAEAEEGAVPHETLRVWESPEVAVVLGRASRAADEVNLEACEQAGVPVFRRDSGGTAVVIGPGCSMFALVLSYELRSELRSIEVAHRSVLECHARALARLGIATRCAGTSDLVLAVGEPHCWRKISGNSLRCRQTHCLYHGTFLRGLAGETLARFLRTPPRQPDYRAGRNHAQFVGGVPLEAARLNEELRWAWSATSETEAWPRARVAALVAARYSQAGWNLER